MKKLFLLRRNYGAMQTLGKFVIFDEMEIVNTYYCLELPWELNATNVSCIPEGLYIVRKRFTKERGWHFHILNVPNRSSILIHKGNYVTDILGCQLPGIGLTDLNEDGLLDVTSSGVALGEMLDILPHEFTYKIAS